MPKAAGNSAVSRKWAKVVTVDASDKIDAVLLRVRWLGVLDLSGECLGGNAWGWKLLTYNAEGSTLSRHSREKHVSCSIQ